MPAPSVFAVQFAIATLDHLDAIERRHHRRIQSHLHRLLAYEPDAESRNRKRLRAPAPFGATWELRFGPANRFRAYYVVDRPRHMVTILAIGRKERNRVWIGDEEFTI
jgi:hypothetical protein